MHVGLAAKFVIVCSAAIANEYSPVYNTQHTNAMPHTPHVVLTGATAPTQSSLLFHQGLRGRPHLFVPPSASVLK